MRLFFAAPLPEDVREDLADLRSDLGKVRWVPAAQLHLTLRFLGELDQDRTSQLCALVRARREVEPWPAVHVAIRGVGVFGSPSRPRVLWAAIDPIEAVRSIAGALEACAVELGLAPEARPFRAHVTLARFTRADGERVRAFLRAHASFATPAFDVPEVVLYRSTLGDRGAVHEPLERFALGS